jgi:hypothetical protein
MPNLFLIQLVGVILTVGGLIALIASIALFGTPRSPEERRRATDEWNRRRDATAYRLPINLETFLSGIFFLSGAGILARSQFNLCAFLAFWFPSLPQVARLLLSCT